MDTHTLSLVIEPYDVSSCIIHRRGENIYHYEKTKSASSQLMPVNSCTKSVLSSLICIAMDQGLLPAPDTPAYQFFPQLKHDADERKRSITLQHLLTLAAGFRWTEFGGANSFPKMTRSDDWVQYVLDQPMSDRPGTKMNYNSGVSQLLAALLVQATDTTIAQFAEQHLFGPLAIEQYNWKSDPQHIHTGGYGLELTANDMLKFGLLYLHKGVWNNEVIISEAMVDLSTKPAIAATPPEFGFYGWHWWTDTVSLPQAMMNNVRNELPYYYARGFGGQYIIIVPMLDTVVVLTRVQRKKGLSPLDLFKQHIAPLIAHSTADKSSQHR